MKYSSRSFQKNYFHAPWTLLETHWLSNSQFLNEMNRVFCSKQISYQKLLLTLFASIQDVHVCQNYFFFIEYPHFTKISLFLHPCHFKNLPCLQRSYSHHKKHLLILSCVLQAQYLYRCFLQFHNFFSQMSGCHQKQYVKIIVILFWRISLLEKPHILTLHHFFLHRSQTLSASLQS